MNYNLINKNTFYKNINVKSKEYRNFIHIYQSAVEYFLKTISQIKSVLNKEKGYIVIQKISHRIKSSQSIMGKLTKKKIMPTYGNLVNKIKDIAGIRLVCNFEEDIYLIKDIIESMDNILVLEEKDYLNKPKSSGYRAYHLIIGVLVDRDYYVPVEIQIRTVLMDFWSVIEHEVRYKKKSELSMADSYRLTMYAKIMDYLSLQMGKIYRKQILLNN